MEVLRRESCINRPPWHLMLPATEDAVTDRKSDNLSSRIGNDRALQRRFYIATYTRSPIRTLHTYLSSQAAILLNHDGSERKQGFIYIILLFI